MNVLFAPDWSTGVPYQSLLARHLSAYDVNVSFLRDYHRVLPLSRALGKRHPDLLHLHWPEAYWPIRRDHLDFFRLWRYPLDLTLARRHCPIVYTAHNLWPHNLPLNGGIRRAVQTTLQRADVVIVHSTGARDEMLLEFPFVEKKCHVIPHGDLSTELGVPVPRDKARAQLGLDARPVALVFGRVEPYKGTDEIIHWWNAHRPDVFLVIAGAPAPLHAPQLQSLAGNNPNIRFELRHLNNEDLRLWLSAADCTVFNYQRIFTSGAASLARSWGVPVLLPERLQSVDLGEPSPYVHRFRTFADDFAPTLQAALAIPPDYSAAQSWRKSIAWDTIAQRTAALYHL